MSDPVAELQAKVDRLDGASCSDCGQRLCGHQSLFSIALGVPDRPKCLSCLARSLARQSEELRDSLLQHFRHRDCYQQVWNLATEREGRQHDGLPSCLWPESASPVEQARPIARASPSPEPDASPMAGDPDVEWDAGEMACGELVMQLRRRLQSLSPGSVLCLVARDRGAVEDIPAWCRLTGHRLFFAEHPSYRIERKQE